MNRFITDTALNNIAQEHAFCIRALPNAPDDSNRAYFEGKRFAFAEALSLITGMTWGEADDMLRARTSQPANPTR